MKTVKGTQGHMMDMPSMLPSFSMSAADLPAIKDWRIGQRYHLEMEVEMISASKDEYVKGSPMSARFKIHKIKDDKKSVKKRYA